MTEYHDGSRVASPASRVPPTSIGRSGTTLLTTMRARSGSARSVPTCSFLRFEARAIEERCWTAFYDGRATQEMRPALPADRSRHNELDAILKRRLEIDPRNYIRSGARSGRSTAGTGGVSRQPKVSGAVLDGG